MEFSRLKASTFAWVRRFRKPRYFVPLLIGVVLILIFFSRGDDVLAGIETQPAAYQKVAIIVSETGSVRAAQEASLSFAQPGRIAEIFVEEGESVSRGDPLVAIDDTSQYAERLAAEARLRAEQARLMELVTGARDSDLEAQEAAVVAAEVAVENAKENLDRVRDQQDTLVDNARAAFLSNDLNALLTEGGREGTNFDYTPPTISGTYTSEEEGQYVIELYRSNAPSNYSFRYEGLESGVGEVSTTEPQPLGSRGLLIQFPEDFARGSAIEWIVNVPNENSATFVTMRNALRAAEAARESAIQAAEGQLKSAEAALSQAEAQLRVSRASTREERIAAQRAAVEQMRAAFVAAAYLHENAILRAPFDGMVTQVFVEVGEVAGATPAVSLISDGSLEVEVEVPEADIAEISVGDKATISFDAYDDVELEGEVIYVSPTARDEEGVPVFLVRIAFLNADERVRAGLSADVDIDAAARDNVLAVPARSLFREDGITKVRVLEDGELKKISITTGLRGTEGLIEITSGLSEGDEVVTFIEPAILAELEASEQ